MRTEKTISRVCRQNLVINYMNLYHCNMDDLKMISKVMSKLPAEERMLFAMHVSGFKYGEISKKMDLPVEVVRSRIFFTRQQVQLLLGNEMDN